MHTNHEVSPEKMARKIWLLYFNKTLFEKGIITEQQHRQMMVKIRSQ